VPRATHAAHELRVDRRVLWTYEHPPPFHDPITSMSKYAGLVDRPVMVNYITYSAHPHLNNHAGQMKSTGCTRRNVPDFGRVFLMLKYTDITQNTYVQD